MEAVLVLIYCVIVLCDIYLFKNFERILTGIKLKEDLTFGELFNELSDKYDLPEPESDTSVHWVLILMPIIHLLPFIGFNLVIFCFKKLSKYDGEKFIEILKLKIKQYAEDQKLKERFEEGE